MPYSDDAASEENTPLPQESEHENTREAYVTEKLRPENKEERAESNEQLISDDSEMTPAPHRDLVSLRPSARAELPLERMGSQNSITKSKRPSKRPSQHSRSQSNGRNTAVLSTSSSNRPYALSRSKSTELILRMGNSQVKRSNKSFTKLTSLNHGKGGSSVSMNRAVNALQPLTKTTLNSSIGRGSVAMQPLTKTMLRDSAKHYALRKTISNGSQKASLARNKSEQSIKSNKSSSSLKLANAQHAGLKSSNKRGRAILKLNEEFPDENYEDVSDDSEAGDDQDTSSGNKVEPEERRQFSTEDLNEDDDSEEQPTSTFRRRQSPKPDMTQSDYKTTDSSSEDLASRNMYGGSFLLSQSTGMTRKLDPKSEMLEYTSFAEDASRASKALGKSGGIVFQPSEERGRDLELAAKPSGTKTGSYQANQSIFSNLQRNDPQYSENTTQRPQLNNKKSINLMSNRDFAGYLESNNGNSNAGLETRTQQKLWLQRENSLMDVSSNLDPYQLTNFSNLSLNKLMFAHNMSSNNIRDMHLLRKASAANYDFLGTKGEMSPATPNEPTANLNNFMNIIQSMHQNSIQSRTEFERLNREYVNVRRHLNPVASSLGRVDQYLQRHPEIAFSNKPLPSGETDKDGLTSELYKAQQINRFWQEALHTSSASSVSLKRYQDDQLQQQYQEVQRQERPNDDSTARERLSRFHSGSVQTRAVKSGGNSLKQRS